MRWTFVGRRRRAELTVEVPERAAARPMFTVRLLTATGNPDGACLAASDLAYSGPNGVLAWQQISAWTGAGLAGVPRKIVEYLRPREVAKRARGRRERNGR
jgi:hypothetical protein